MTITASAPVDTTPPAPAPTLAKVILTPASASLVSSGTQKFAAYGRNSVGDSVAVTVTYAATGGTISSTGLYTAGSTGGTFRVVAAASGISDTSTVSVSRSAARAVRRNRVAVRALPAAEQHDRPRRRSR